MAAFKFKIKSTSETSTTQQVANQIREAIETGRFQPGERLPSEMEIANQLGMSRGVAKKAYAKLKNLGLFTNSGTGRVVSLAKGKNEASGGKKPSATATGATKTKTTGAAKKAPAAAAKKPARKK